MARSECEVGGISTLMRLLLYFRKACPHENGGQAFSIPRNDKLNGAKEAENGHGGDKRYSWYFS